MKKKPTLSKEEVEALTNLPNPFVLEPWEEFYPKLKVGSVIQYGNNPRNLYEVVGLNTNNLEVDLIFLGLGYCGRVINNYTLPAKAAYWKFAPPLSPSLSLEELL